MRKTVNKQKLGQQRAYSRKHSVTNNTIPPLVKGKLVKDEDTGKLVNNLIRENGNGPKWSKPEHKTYLNITTGSCKHRDRKTAKLILSDSGIFQLKTVFKPLVKTSAAYMEAYAQHKFEKWLKKNPRPVQTEMFEGYSLESWEKAKEEALARCRDFVISVYDPLPLIGRYESSEGKYKHKEVTRIKDKASDIRVHGGINNVPTNATLLKMAQKFTDMEKKRNSSLISTNLLDHTRKVGRILLPRQYSLVA